MAEENKLLTVITEDKVQTFVKEIFDTINQNFVTNKSLNLNVEKIVDKINNVGRT